MSDNNSNTNSNTSAVSEKAGSWFKGLKAEFNKIAWETRENVTKQTISVVVVSVIVGVIIAILDMIMQYGIDFIINIGG
ncbi:MAG: preprotein translocase subunit SecE [Lachnospiraceae bacterium]|nr:preprotein translocase subunit SecE [Lachnospiraceae bacterium]